MSKTDRKLCLSVISTVLFLFVSVAGYSQDKDMGGWDREGAYNKLYKASELDRLKCSVKKTAEVVPLKGMSPGVALIVEDADGEEIMVHVGPKWYLGDSTGISRGDKLKIRGSWAEIDGKDVFMASKIKKGDYFELKVRLTKDGTPFWTMTAEERAKELAQE